MVQKANSKTIKEQSQAKTSQSTREMDKHKKGGLSSNENKAVKDSKAPGINSDTRGKSQTKNDNLTDNKNNNSKL
jgi:hypothetical protein